MNFHLGSGFSADCVRDFCVIILQNSWPDLYEISNDADCSILALNSLTIEKYTLSKLYSYAYSDVLAYGIRNLLSRIVRFLRTDIYLIFS